MLPLLLASSKLYSICKWFINTPTHHRCHSRAVFRIQPPHYSLASRLPRKCISFPQSKHCKYLHCKTQSSFQAPWRVRLNASACKHRNAHAYDAKEMVDLYHTFWIRPWPRCLPPQNILSDRRQRARERGRYSTRWDRWYLIAERNKI